MKNYYLILLSIFILSCNNERVLLLPEVEQAEVTEVLDVSPAYIFYDETQPDSVLLNRKNLISTTNWLVNVDKRLTLKQAIPHIKFLQDKKRDAKMHKNENAKNYFTCNDTSIGDLGFIEFTDVSFHNNSKKEDVIKYSFKKEPTLLIEYNIDLKFKVYDVYAGKIRTYDKSTYNNMGPEIFKGYGKIALYFNSNVSFQDYISIKSKLQKIKSNKFIINTNEFIF